MQQTLKKLQELEKTLAKKIIRNATVDALNVIADQARKNAPIGETGELANSVRVNKKAPRGMVGGNVIAGNKDAHYARFVEVGTVNVPPVPFMRRALDEKKDEAIRTFVESIEKALK